MSPIAIEHDVRDLPISGWWLGGDGNWYPPEHRDTVAGAGTATVTTIAGAAPWYRLAPVGLAVAVAVSLAGIAAAAVA